jgi:predicted amidophosphoribosyltransferase
MAKACKWHGSTPDEFCWACQNVDKNPICDECGQHLNACHERDELQARLAAAEARWTDHE